VNAPSRKERWRRTTAATHTRDEPSDCQEMPKPHAVPVFLVEHRRRFGSADGAESESVRKAVRCVAPSLGTASRPNPSVPPIRPAVLPPDGAPTAGAAIHNRTHNAIEHDKQVGPPSKSAGRFVRPPSWETTNRRFLMRRIC